MFAPGFAMVLCLVDNFLRMFDPDAQGKRLGFDQNILAMQHFKDIPGRVTGCQNYRIRFPGFAIIGS